MATTTNLLLGGITFNEIGYDPSGTPGFDTDGAAGVSGNNDEFIEFINVSGSSVNMTGVQLWDSNGGLTYTFGAVTLAAGEKFVLIGESADLTSFQTNNPGVQSDVADNTSFNLNNNVEEFALVDTSGNYITLTYLEPTQVPPTSVTLQPGFTGTNLLSSETVNLPAEADGQSIQRVTDGDTAFAIDDATPGAANVCFATDTLIATPAGERRVQDLQTGDLILAADGRAVPVLWLGVQKVTSRFGPAERLRPVRFAAGSLGNGLPHSDLTVTADHAMLVDGLLCNASALVNGDTITRVPLAAMGADYTVYHIETEAHEIIRANGAETETYIDHISRRVFDNYAEYEAMYGQEVEMQELSLPRITTARQVPEHIRARLAKPAAA